MGLDLSTSATGLVVLWDKGDKRPELMMEEVIKYPKLTGFAKFREIETDIQYAQNYFKPGKIVIEGYGFSFKHAGSIIPLVTLGSIVRLGLWMKGLSWLEASPMELKKFATGKGNSDKKVVTQFVKQIWGHDAKTHDTADAYVLAMMGLVHGMKGAGTPEMQEIAFALKSHS
jgi:crossover junction endodeoxyribonuclease RuvC